MAAGEVGEMLLRAPQHMVGVLEQPGRNRARRCARMAPAEPWIHTGDLAYMDDDGLHLPRRSQEGHAEDQRLQVWPREIEGGAVRRIRP